MTSENQSESLKQDAQGLLAATAGSAYRPLAHKDGINLIFGLLMASGAMCPKCGFGTRVTSKNWARCKKCGERVCRVKRVDKLRDAAYRSKRYDLSAPLQDVKRTLYKIRVNEKTPNDQAETSARSRNEKCQNQH